MKAWPLHSGSPKNGWLRAVFFIIRIQWFIFSLLIPVQMASLLLYIINKERNLNGPPKK
jgi:hypothetical protein